MFRTIDGSIEIDLVLKKKKKKDKKLISITISLIRAFVWDTSV